ncbi:MAG TPA: A/G-specific adenine glycosylase [Armatimonadota bacterium]|nr:A/G-specific adenine glycosylase [Armatimonadota bacterium]
MSARLPDQALCRELNGHLLRWYGRCRRTFPWRSDASPYRILVSEVLLQKTTGPQVAEIFEQFIQRYPRPRALARGRVRTMARLVAPLGLFKRAEWLRSIGRELVDRFEGEVPADPADLLSLPGVGPYGANAVRCFAFGERVAIVDRNVWRVLSRILGLTECHPRRRPPREIWEAAQHVLPPRAHRNWNWAIIDLAAARCRPRDPACERCPLNSCCLSASS